MATMTIAATTAPSAATRPATLTDRIPCPGLLPWARSAARHGTLAAASQRRNLQQRCVDWRIFPLRRREALLREYEAVSGAPRGLFRTPIRAPAPRPRASAR